MRIVNMWAPDGCHSSGRAMGEDWPASEHTQIKGRSYGPPGADTYRSHFQRSSHWPEQVRGPNGWSCIDPFGCCGCCGEYAKLTEPWGTPFAVRMQAHGARFCDKCKTADKHTLADEVVIRRAIAHARRYRGLADWVRALVAHGCRSHVLNLYRNGYAPFASRAA
jgi:hypothetical protein